MIQQNGLDNSAKQPVNQMNRNRFIRLFFKFKEGAIAPNNLDLKLMNLFISTNNRLNIGIRCSESSDEWDNFSLALKRFEFIRQKTESYRLSNNLPEIEYGFIYLRGGKGQAPHAELTTE